MSTDKAGGSQQQQGSTTYTPTPEETQMNQLDLELRKQAQGGLGSLQQGSLDILNQLIRGGSLPGFLSGIEKGISPEVTQGLVNKSLRDIQPQFAQSGLLDSGVNASISARTAGDIRLGSEEFNIGNKMNLLQMALGGQAQVQQPILAQSQALGGRLAGLRSSNTTGSTTYNSYTKPSFLTSFNNTFGSQGAFGNSGAFGGSGKALIATLMGRG